MLFGAIHASVTPDPTVADENIPHPCKSPISSAARRKSRPGQGHGEMMAIVAAMESEFPPTNAAARDQICRAKIVRFWRRATGCRTAAMGAQSRLAGILADSGCSCIRLDSGAMVGGDRRCVQTTTRFPCPGISPGRASWVCPVPRAGGSFRSAWARGWARRSPSRTPSRPVVAGRGRGAGRGCW